MRKQYTCVLCGETLFGYGNNALPIKKGLCCDNCNIEVIRERLVPGTKQAEEENQNGN